MIEIARLIYFTLGAVLFGVLLDYKLIYKGSKFTLLLFLQLTIAALAWPICVGFAISQIRKERRKDRERKEEEFKIHLFNREIETPKRFLN